MAFTNIAAQVTLGQVIDNIRELTDTVSEEESGLYRVPLVNMIHDALLLVVSKHNPDEIRALYLVEPTTVAEASNLIDISALDIASFKPEDLSYSDSLNGAAIVMSLAEFESLKTIYSTSMMANFFIAYVANIGDKFQIRTYRGSGLVPAGALKLGYIRNPAKTTVDTTKMDCTEAIAREVIQTVSALVRDRAKANA